MKVRRRGAMLRTMSRRRPRFADAIASRTILIDGGMGTSLQEMDLDIERDFLGQENCSEALVISRPELLGGIHGSFLAVGADAVETNTFGANQLVLAEFGLAHRTREINCQAVQIAREACEKYATDDKPRFVLGSIGPGTRLVTLGQVDWKTMHASYLEQVHGLIDGGADALLIETAQDLLQLKVAVNACLDALRARNLGPDDLPIMVNVTIETTGTMLLGTEIAAAAIALAPYPIASLGLNCATGPVEMTEHVRWLSEHWNRTVCVVPNAGLPVLVEGRTEYPLAPQPFAEKLHDFVERLGVGIVGGCCGTTPGHIEATARAIESVKPGKRTLHVPAASCTSLYGPVEFRQDASILNVGERTNASGSRLFKRLLEEENWDEMMTLARDMMREGSHVIDVNVDYAGRDNAKDMRDIVGRLVRQINAPLMLDSTQIDTLEAGLQAAGGRCIINSANLEEGEERFLRMCALARRYGAALVLGCIDEDPQEAMARTAERKEEIAARMHAMATGAGGLAAGDIFFDPLVLPISTGMEKDRRSALETIEGTRRIAARFPECQITCGLSNVSFGLKPAARVVLNSVFLHELTEAGMTSAILHVSKILPRTRIDDRMWDAALDLVYNRPPQQPVELRDGTETTDPLQIFIDLFDDASESEARVSTEDLPLEDRLRRHIIDGEKRGLTEALEEARLVHSPLAIINDHLLDGMKTVGEYFASGRMQLPFVLQSAEVMKAAVAHLEQYMERVEGSTRGSIVLATVKGDVHDIGKNLVDIILTNNGYLVHNIGIKQPGSAVIEALRKTGAQAIGLSGLLVKSVVVMEENLAEFTEAGIDVPVLLGGAALARHHCESHLRPKYGGGVYYGKDAFEGLRIMDYVAGGRTAELDTEIEERRRTREDAIARTADVRARAAEASAAASDAVSASGGGQATGVAEAPRSRTARGGPLPKPPFWGTRTVESIEPRRITPFVNKVALYRGQWQLKRGAMSEQEYAQLIEDRAEPVYRRLCAQAEAGELLEPAVVYGWFPCLSQGDDLIIFDPEDHEREAERFTFPRQTGRERRCISNFFRSVDDAAPGERDVIGMHCVTMGHRPAAAAKRLFEGNDYVEYLYVHGFGVECAEALAELWHKRMREELGIGNDDATDIRKLFSQHYQGSRYSFGYPACPEMADQEKLFRLLDPSRIGCELTENWQIDPEQSTSAIIVHHPEAKYFSV